MQDQWERGNDMFGGGARPNLKPLDWGVIAEHDKQRHERARQLLAAGKVETATEFSFIALLFQHSGQPDELLLAHVLAQTAAIKGDASAKWLAAATLDRYLLSIKQPQIYGTQLHRNENGEWTQEPFARETISDSLRAQSCVISIAEQQQILKINPTGLGGFSTTMKDCK